MSRGYTELCVVMAAAGLLKKEMRMPQHTKMRKTATLSKRERERELFQVQEAVLADAMHCLRKPHTVSRIDFQRNRFGIYLSRDFRRFTEWFEILVDSYLFAMFPVRGITSRKRTEHDKSDETNAPEKSAPVMYAHEKMGSTSAFAKPHTAMPFMTGICPVPPLNQDGEHKTSFFSEVFSVHGFGKMNKWKVCGSF